MLIKPDYASFEATLKCDLRCTHCGLPAGIARPTELNTEEAKLALQKLADFGVKNLVVSGGEFTMRNDWTELVQFALMRFDFVRLISNGRLGREYVYRLEKMKNWDRLLMSISLDGTREVHDIRRGAGSYEKIREILETPTFIPINLMSTIAKDNYLNLIGIYDLCLRYEVASWSISIGLPEGNMKRDDFLGEDKLRFSADFIHKCQQEQKGKLDVIADDCSYYFHPMREGNPWRGCQGGRRLITVLSDGSITGCPTWIGKTCGNILTDDLKKIWTSESMEKFREAPDQCKKCGKCPGGCKAVQHVFGKQFCGVGTEGGR